MTRIVGRFLPAGGFPARRRQAIRESGSQHYQEIYDADEKECLGDPRGTGIDGIDSFRPWQSHFPGLNGADDNNFLQLARNLRESPAGARDQFNINNGTEIFRGPIK